LPDATRHKRLSHDRYAAATAARGRHFMLSLRDWATFLPKGSRENPMRRLALLVAMLVSLACAAGAAASPLYVLSGHGWGHGIGMSQWGAQGYALAGKTHEQILAHYYEGTTLGERTGKVRVLLTSGRTSFPFASTRSIIGAGKSVPAGTYTVHRSGTNVVFGGKTFSGGTYFSSQGLLRVDGQKFRGDVQITADGSLAAINRLSLEAYVRGVVANESPASWQPEALQAQADAARSYALATGGHCGTGILCRGTSDQVYGGVGSETPSTNAAVAATPGEVVLSGSQVAATFFFSTSGGKTVNKAEEWGGTDVSYLQTETDPYDSISPHHNWGPLDAEEDCPGSGRDCVFTTAQMSSRLGMAGVRGVKVVSRNSGSRVEELQVGAPGGPQTRTGAEFRSALGLRSTWFSVGVLKITPSLRTSICGDGVRLDLLVRHVANVTLQRRPTLGGAWQDIPVTKTSAERYTAVDKPCMGTSYRLHSPAATGANVAVKVAPRIVFRATQPAGAVALRGIVRPTSLAGQRVYVARRRNDGSWHRVASAVVRSDGSWRANFHVIEGVYRARIVPPASSGLIPGVSPPLTVELS
jgi:stage II sporulation protein D